MHSKKDVILAVIEIKEFKFQTRSVHVMEETQVKLLRLDGSSAEFGIYP